jgi:hypothetical protein
MNWTSGVHASDNPHLALRSLKTGKAGCRDGAHSPGIAESRVEGSPESDTE